MTSTSMMAVALLLACLQLTARCTDASETHERTLQDAQVTGERQKPSRVERNAGSLELADAPNSDEREKRKWQKNTVRVWGKRDQDVLDTASKGFDYAGTVGTDDEAGTDKRHWSPRNKVRVWGKRSELDNSDQGIIARPIAAIEAGEAEVDMEEKRKWADNRVKVWGKRSESSALPFAWNAGHQNPTTGNDIMNEENNVDLDELVKQRVSVVKRAIDDSMAADGSAHRGGGRYIWVPDDDIWSTEAAAAAARSLPLKLSSAAAEKRAPSGHSSLMSTSGGRYWRADGGGPKRSWRTNVIRVWG